MAFGYPRTTFTCQEQRNLVYNYRLILSNHFPMPAFVGADSSECSFGFQCGNLLFHGLRFGRAPPRSPCLRRVSSRERVSLILERSSRLKNLIKSSKRSDIVRFQLYLRHISDAWNYLSCITDSGEISDICKPMYGVLYQGLAGFSEIRFAEWN